MKEPFYVLGSGLTHSSDNMVHLYPTSPPDPFVNHDTLILTLNTKEKKIYFQVNNKQNKCLFSYVKSGQDIKYKIGIDRF